MPTATPTPTFTPEPTATPTDTPTGPKIAGEEFFLYSVYWGIEPDSLEPPLNESDFNTLNQISDDLIDWFDVYQYMEKWRGYQ